MATAAGLADVDLTDLDNFADGFPHHLFELHRREAPVWHHQPTAHTPDGEGFWSVATYAEVLEVLRDPDDVLVGAGRDRRHGGTLLQDLDVAGSVLDDDGRPPPRPDPAPGERGPHATHGRAGSRTTSATAPAHWSTTSSRRRADRLRRATSPPSCRCRRSASLLGVPEEDRHQLVEAVDPAFDFREGDAGSPPGRGRDHRRRGTVAYAGALIAEKRARPDRRHALGGRPRHAGRRRPAHALRRSSSTRSSSCCSRPARRPPATPSPVGCSRCSSVRDQLAQLRADPRLLPRSSRRCCAGRPRRPRSGAPQPAPPSLGGQTIDAGRQGAGLGGLGQPGRARCSTGPPEFDIRRDPEPAPAFGHGVHHCLGASLARLEIRVLFEELLPRFAGYELLQPAEWTRSNRHIGLRHLHVAFTPT